MLWHRCRVGRYLVERSSGFSRAWWRIRGRLVDSETGEAIETRHLNLAEELAVLLERADAGQLEPAPANASPFRAYDAFALSDWFYVTFTRRTSDSEYVARSRSASLANRSAEVLNCAHPRTLRRRDSRVRAGWF